jgi:hypothetical protein
MRSLTPIQLTRRAGSVGVRVGVSALLLSTFAAPPALAQGGGVTAPQSGGVPAPDPAPERATPKPDAAPGADSDSVEAAPTPQTSPAPATPPDTTSTAPETSSGVPAAFEPAAPRAGRPGRHASSRRAGHKPRDTRKERQRDRRSTVGRASPASVFGVNHALVAGVGGNTEAESPPVELIAWALLTLVVAAAALLTLTAQLSRMEGLTGPMPHDTQWLQRVFHIARFAPRGARRRPAS